MTTPEVSKRTFEPNDFPVETILFNLIAPEKASNTFTDVVAFQTIIGTGWILGGKTFNPNWHDRALQVSGARQYTKKSYGDLTPLLA